MKRKFSILLSALFAWALMGCQSNVVEKKAGVGDTFKGHRLKDTISIVAVGDIMLGSGYPNESYLPPDDAVDSFKAVHGLLKGDIVFANLEGCFLDSGESDKCKKMNPNNCYAFRMPSRYAEIFKKAGFNVLSVANNHVGDFNKKGRQNTAKILDSLQIHYAGQLDKPFDLFEIDSIKYAFIAFAPNQNTVDIRKINKAKQLVSSLKQQVDIVIVSFHGGAEGAIFEHVNRATEMYHNENRGDVYAFSHAVIDAGADVVLGHGPHVTRAVEVYKNKFIAYSLGNFCTYGRFNLSGPNGVAPILKLKVNLRGDFLYADVISVKQDKINRLTLDDKHAAFKRMKYLTIADFKDHELTFENNRITKADEKH